MMAAIALRMLSVFMGVFLLFMGIDKIGWFTDGGAFLSGRLYEWVEYVRPSSRWYLENVAIPGLRVFSILVPIGELATGAALVCGFRVRAAAAVALAMVLNFHFASDVLLQYSYLINGYGPPVVGSLLALALGGKGLPYSVRG
jgi:thiosulfate dehydrogenase [quinone] large subunit